MKKELKYQLSPNVRIVSDNESELSMVYHTLYGNPRVVNNEGLRFLNCFRRPLSIKKIAEICEEDPDNTIRQFREILFIVECGSDETIILRQKKEQQLNKIQERQTIDRIGLAINDSCNFECPHCIHGHSTNNHDQIFLKVSKVTPQFNMAWTTTKRCIDHYITLMREQGVTHGKIHFGNAEPLINWPVIERVLEYCGEIKDLSFDFAINTNLTLINRKIAETCQKYQVRIATSLDGTRVANDAIRIAKNGQGTFANILNKFDLLEEIGYPLDGFSITVTQGNFELIDTEIIDLAIERKMTSIAFDYDLVGLVGVSVEKRVTKLMSLKRYANAHGIDFFGTWDSPFRNLTSESLLSGDHAFCAAVQGKALEFNVDGSIKICSHTTTTVGHVDNFNAMFEKESDLTQIVAARFPGADDYCVGCDIEGSCGGQCHVTREVVARSAGENQQKFFTDMCNFYRSITKALAIEYIKINYTTTMNNCSFNII